MNANHLVSKRDSYEYLRYPTSPYFTSTKLTTHSNFVVTITTDPCVINRICWGGTLRMYPIKSHVGFLYKVPLCFRTISQDSNLKNNTDIQSKTVVMLLITFALDKRLHPHVMCIETVFSTPIV